MQTQTIPELSLSQYYDREIKKLQFQSWKHFCAFYKHKPSFIEHVKKTFKKEYKNAIRQNTFRKKQKEIKNATMEKIIQNRRTTRPRST